MKQGKWKLSVLATLRTKYDLIYVILLIYGLKLTKSNCNDNVTTLAKPCNMIAVPLHRKQETIKIQIQIQI